MPENDFSEHSEALKVIGEAQKSDTDEREQAREARNFLDKRDGQWEPEIWRRFRGARRPRYTLDKCNPVVNQIAGEIKKADFSIKVRPSGGNSTKDLADFFGGMIRNIENISKASFVYSHAAKNMTGTGIDGWQIVQDWTDTESFEQDLFIRPISDFVNSVWFDPNSKNRDRSDSKWAIKLTALGPDEYKAKWPEGSTLSISQDQISNVYTYKPESIFVGEFYFIEERQITLIQMNTGAVYREDDLEPLKDELAEKGIIEVARRKRPDRIVKVRHMDGGGWLNEEQETVFSWIPLIPTYGNFNIVENKIIYSGAIEKLIDPQRIYNYARSRQIEEGALSPRDKYFMTAEQAEGHTDSLNSMNINSDPVQLYNHVGGQPPPFKGGPANVNPSLETTAAAAREDIVQASGLFSASMGDNPGLQSGVAINMLQERGDTGSLDYFEAQEVAICHTAKILIDAIPKVYDTQRQIRILNEDGSFDTEIINQMTIDEESGDPIMLNDLSKGRYDVVCDVGKSFKNRQQESVAAIIEMAQIDPTVIQEGGDVLLNNTNAPGLDLIAERKRAQLLQAGIIPESQWTDEERQQIQKAEKEAQQEPPEPSPEMVLAQAEQKKAEADIMAQQINQQKLLLEAEKIKLKAQELELEKTRVLLEAQANQLKAENERLKTVTQAQQTGAKTDNLQANTAKIVNELQTEASEKLSQLVDSFSDDI